MADIPALPPGQIERQQFPRFGLGKFARRFPADPDRLMLGIRGDVGREMRIGNEFQSLPRIEQQSDFHCVTTWSVRGVRWGGVRFLDFYEQIALPLAKPLPGAELVVLRGEDGYCSCLPLEDLLHPDVILADRLDDQPLDVAHGAPLRLVAPAHYGYKNVKHLVSIEFWKDRRRYRFPFPYPAFMDHPRARVAFEERGRFFPSWMLRHLYRLLIPFSVWNFERALARYRARRLSGRQR
ncbi:DMSO/TMAO reductase YedYZ molybdopterin-dependent catalytic subunit [Panacagrimonas perspica]|uniref:DMSO/TMAO reductase YedYZ molybdopterin-dependent catalytic subunit n=1 Tax=Panacagrimonas perspica TaxID=381431 RepID=A0A4R7PDN4_9GAMM|nr:molybdopterin-dependent oxidoreductase [Panacagrimonas perspica]TDU31862.1 DMSO/TMAO reductase YedYZ molybdopterin-dependent catalytic subunit [Panacagrimonas perspica]THD02937.1 hypothetical protein B1810_10010 [Panacagrimonas perspica]